MNNLGYSGSNIQEGHGLCYHGVANKVDKLSEEHR